MVSNSYQKNKKPFNFEAWSLDKKYGLRIPTKVIQKMLNLCLISGRKETGGILIGYYNRRHDCAIAIDCSAPPVDSKFGKNYFYRGVHGLQKLLKKLWNLTHRRYYLGEWHFHPFGVPEPSEVDIGQLKNNAENPSYHCPEPVMFIVGGNPNKEWMCKSLVYHRKKGVIKLLKQYENRQNANCEDMSE